MRLYKNIVGVQYFFRLLMDTGHYQVSCYVSRFVEGASLSELTSPLNTHKQFSWKQFVVQTTMENIDEEEGEIEKENVVSNEAEE